MTTVVEMQRLFAQTEEFFNGSFAATPEAIRDARDMVRRTKDLATDLLREINQVRVQNILLEKQKQQAEERLDQSVLGKEIEQMKAELDQLNKRLPELEKQSQKFRRRYEDVEQYNMALSNVYIASNQLHATLDFTEVVKTAGEILWNLVAAPVYAIFLRDEKRGDLMLVGGEGLEGRFSNDRLREPTGMIAEAMNEGVSLFIDGETSGDPLACVPLKIEERGVIGVINVYEIEPHKGGLSDIDKELFDLLASQTATAMTSSRVYSDTLKKLKSMESFINLIKPA